MKIETFYQSKKEIVLRQLQYTLLVKEIINAKGTDKSRKSMIVIIALKKIHRSFNGNSLTLI